MGAVTREKKGHAREIEFEDRDEEEGEPEEREGVDRDLHKQDGNVMRECERGGCGLVPSDRTGIARLRSALTQNILWQASGAHVEGEAS